MQKTGTRSSSTYSKRRRWTAKEAREALADAKRAGLTLQAFAAREGLDPQRLVRWSRQLASSMDAPAFEEVVVDDAAMSPLDGDTVVGAERERFEIVLRSGRVVRVPDAFDVSALRRLLEVVDEVRAC
jgi:transposase-like protein